MNETQILSYNANPCYCFGAHSAMRSAHPQVWVQIVSCYCKEFKGNYLHRSLCGHLCGKGWESAGFITWHLVLTLSSFWSFIVYISLCSLSPTHPSHTSSPEEKQDVRFGMKKKVHVVISSLSIRGGVEHSVLLPIKFFLQQLEQVGPKGPRNTYTKWLEWLPPPSWDFNLWTRILITLMNIIKLICKDKTKIRKIYCKSGHAFNWYK